MKQWQCSVLLVLSVLFWELGQSQLISVPLADRSEIKLLEKSHHLDGFAKSLLKEWMPMDIYESLNFFSAYEVCQGFTARDTPGCQQRFPSQVEPCSVAGGGVGHLHFLCPSLTSAFYRHQSTKPWPETRTIVDLMILMLKHGYDTLLVFGDSVTGQHMADLACQLQRFGIDRVWNGATITIKHLDKFFQERPISFDPVTDAKPIAASSIFRIHYVQLMGHSEWPERFRSFKEYVDRLREGSAVVLFNAGLHYNNNPEQLRKTAEDFVNYTMKVLIPDKKFHVFFRETSAQHFPSGTGQFQTHFTLPQGRKFSLEDEPIRRSFNGTKPSLQDFPANESHPSAYFTSLCEPLKSAKAYHEQNWRNQLVIKEIEKVDPTFQQISVLPFYHITAARYDLHLDHFDCTHYCYGPMLWAPMTHRLVMKLHKKLVFPVATAANSSSNV
jgi:hypothetical protein